MLIYLILATIIGALFYTLNVVIYNLNRSNYSTGDLLTTYECGFEPIANQSRSQHSLSYYLIALLYVIFDLEVALILPALVGLTYLGMAGSVILIAVMSLLCLAFVYELRLGTFNYVNPLQ